MNHPSRETIKMLMNTAYGFQQLRIMTGNRLAANFRIKLGVAPGMKKSEIPEAAKNILDTLLADQFRLADALASGGRKRFKARLSDDGIISDEFEYEAIGHYMTLLQAEQDAFKAVGRAVRQHPLWTGFFKDVRGVGETMAAVCISEFDVHVAKHVSAFWKYAGLDVADDGRGRSRRKEHLIDVEYIDKNGEKKIRKSITFNAWLKSKLMGVLADCLLVKGKYRTIYDNYKHRLEHHEKHEEKTKAHRHLMAKRYMVKQFLRDLWVAWRELEGLRIDEPYHVAKLGMAEHSEAA